MLRSLGATESFLFKLAGKRGGRKLHLPLAA
jgi:hypothetical protein